MASKAKKHLAEPKRVSKTDGTANREKSAPDDLPDSPSTTGSADSGSSIQVKAPRYSTVWEDEIDTKYMLEAFAEVKAERAKRMNYAAASRLGAALAEHVTDKQTSEAIEVIFALVVSGAPPTTIVKALRAWGPPLSFFISVVAAMETDLRSPVCDVSALKVELAKAMLADAETTERSQ